MNLINRRMLVIALLMGAGAALALAMKPTEKIADAREKFDLEAMIPQQIGEWKIDTSIVPIAPSPEVKSLLDKIYDQTLARTYINNKKERVMLSIAYGGSFADRSMQYHRPEVCYPAQGFEILKGSTAILSSPLGDIPVRRLVAQMGGRHEPVTYWIVVGKERTSYGFATRLIQIKYKLTGKIPDGMLVRLSSIDLDDSHAFRNHEDFARDLLGAVGKTDALRIAGVQR